MVVCDQMFDTASPLHSAPEWADGEGAAEAVGREDSPVCALDARPYDAPQHSQAVYVHLHGRHCK